MARAARARMDITQVIGALPYRVALAGGWIDQPFVSQLNPAGTGSMVVVALEPTCRFMDRCGMGTSTRKVAARLWPAGLPSSDPAELVHLLYEAENMGRTEPSGSQDMIGLIYPGVNRLDYSFEHAGGVFPAHIESSRDPDVARWIERVLHFVPVAQRPDGYAPLSIKNLDPGWIRRLGQSGQDCFEAIVHKDAGALGASMNECMRCWEAILPHTVRHPTLTVDLTGILAFYQAA